MAETKEYIAKTDERGSVIISDEVIASIAGIATAEVEGVVGLGALSVADFINRKSPAKGVKISISDNAVSVNITLVVSKDVVIPTVAEKVQDNVLSAVESMTGIRVEAVNVKVGGIQAAKDKKKTSSK